MTWEIVRRNLATNPSFEAVSNTWANVRQLDPADPNIYVIGGKRYYAEADGADYPNVPPMPATEATAPGSLPTETAKAARITDGPLTGCEVIWTGAANNSPSIVVDSDFEIQDVGGVPWLRGRMPVNCGASSTARVVSSSRWAKTGGHSARVIRIADGDAYSMLRAPCPNHLDSVFRAQATGWAPVSWKNNTDVYLRLATYDTPTTTAERLLEPRGTRVGEQVLTSPAIRGSGNNAYPDIVVRPSGTLMGDSDPSIWYDNLLIEDITEEVTA